jgi:hypothetical protein
MLLSTAPENEVSLMLIEGGLTVIAFALPFALPTLGNVLNEPLAAWRAARGLQLPRWAWLRC